MRQPNHPAEPTTIPRPETKPETKPEPTINPQTPEEDDPWDVPQPLVTPSPKALLIL